MTPEPKAATEFYITAIGWEATDAGMAGSHPYTIFSKGPIRIAGLMPTPDDAKGMPPVWTGYIGVDDVDAYTERVRKAGGTVHRAPQEIPGVGRFSVVGDPQGVGFILFHPIGEAQPATRENEPGRVGWHELHAANGEEAFQFYSSMFGWNEVDKFDMGSMGIYRIFAAGGVPIGGMMTKAPEMPMPPHWLYYFNVESAGAAADRIRQAGGTVCMGPHEVPGGQWIVQAIDPHGAHFAVLAPKN